MAFVIQFDNHQIKIATQKGLQFSHSKTTQGAQIFKTNPHYVSDAKAIKEKAAG
jgi:hypothetical protein